MLDIGGTELLVIGLVLILVVGPKDLPRVLRTMGQWSRKMRGLAREFQNSMDDLAREADLEDIRKDLNSVTGNDIAKKVENTVDPDHSLREAASTDYAAETPAPAGGSSAAETPAPDDNGGAAEVSGDVKLADLAPRPNGDGDGQESGAPSEPAPKEDLSAGGAAEA